MNRILQFLLLFFIWIDFEAQTAFVGWDTIPVKFRIDVSPFQYGYGLWSSKTKTDMPEQSSFIFTSINKGLFIFHIDIQTIFKDKVGIETGFDVINSRLDKKKIRNDLQNHIANYKINIAADDYHTGESPFIGNYQFNIFKAGIVGFIPWKKTVILPYLDFLYSIESNYPSLKVHFTDNLNGSSFTREYKFYNTNSNGIKLGASMRGYLKNQNIKRKHSNLYMQLRAEFVYLRTNGYGYYLDKDINGNEFKSSSNNFSQNINSFILGFTLAGFDLHW